MIVNLRSYKKLKNVLHKTFVVFWILCVCLDLETASWFGWNLFSGLLIYIKEILIHSKFCLKFVPRSVYPESKWIGSDRNTCCYGQKCMPLRTHTQTHTNTHTHTQTHTNTLTLAHTHSHSDCYRLLWVMPSMCDPLLPFNASRLCDMYLGQPRNVDFHG